MHKITAVFLKLDDIREAEASLYLSLDEERKAYADAHKKEDDRLRSIGASYLIRKYIGEGKIEEKADGKPYIAGKWPFNVSHSGEYVVLAYGEIEIGVDIEKPRKMSWPLTRVFTSEEKAAARDDYGLTRMWTRKEALSKCIGTGLKEGLKGINAIDDDGAIEHRGNVYYVFSSDKGGYPYSIVARLPFEAVEVDERI